MVAGATWTEGLSRGTFWWKHGQRLKRHFQVTNLPEKVCWHWVVIYWQRGKLLHAVEPVLHCFAKVLCLLSHS